MFRIRRIYDDAAPANRTAISAVRHILRDRFPLLHPDILKQSARRLKFYEARGARPLANTRYETPVRENDDNPPFLVIDTLGRNTTFARKETRGKAPSHNMTTVQGRIVGRRGRAEAPVVRYHNQTGSIPIPISIWIYKRTAMKTITRTLILLIFLLTAAALYAQEPRVRPATWARPIINTDLKNWHQVDDKVYRSAQPGAKEMKAVESFGIKEVLNLRNFFSDEDEAEGTGLVLYRIPSSAGRMTREQVINALKIINDAKGPILVHCWHGADRTGAVIAAWRMAAHGWSAKAAIDEMVNGGFSFHATYDNLIILLEDLDVEQVRRDAGLPARR